MESMALSCNTLVLASVSLVLFLAALAQIHSRKSNKVCYITTCAHIHQNQHFSGSVGLISRFGQFYKSVDPGLVQVNVCTESLRVVDVKIQISPIGRQTVMYAFFRHTSKTIQNTDILSTSSTRDNVNVEM